SANCKTQLSCSNGGVQDVNNCRKCLCPLGWSGVKCTQRPIGTKNITATSKIQTIRYNFDETTKGMEYKTQHYVFQAPAGMKVRMTPTVIEGRWSKSCDQMGIEVKFLNDTRLSGVQVCNSRFQQPTITSETNEMFVQAYTLGEQSIIEMQYKAVH
ncbi:hypothetical protein PFISCL1PPCAC_28188, partial [Pristionchus fissidentatus]